MGSKLEVRNGKMNDAHSCILVSGKRFFTDGAWRYKAHTQMMNRKHLKAFINLGRAYHQVGWDTFLELSRQMNRVR